MNHSTLEEAIKNLQTIRTKAEYPSLIMGEEDIRAGGKVFLVGLDFAGVGCAEIEQVFSGAFTFWLYTPRGGELLIILSRSVYGVSNFGLGYPTPNAIFKDMADAERYYSNPLYAAVRDLFLESTRQERNKYLGVI